MIASLKAVIFTFGMRSLHVFRQKKETFSKISLFLHLQLLYCSLKLRSGSAWNDKCARHEQILPFYFQ